MLLRTPQVPVAQLTAAARTQQRAARPEAHWSFKCVHRPQVSRELTRSEDRRCAHQLHDESTSLDFALALRLGGTRRLRRQSTCGVGRSAGHVQEREGGALCFALVRAVLESLRLLHNNACRLALCVCKLCDALHDDRRYTQHMAAFDFKKGAARSTAKSYSSIAPTGRRSAAGGGAFECAVGAAPHRRRRSASTAACSRPRA